MKTEIERRQQLELAQYLSAGDGITSRRSLASPLFETPVQQLARILRKHVWIILAGTALVSGLFLLRAAFQPKLYRATSNIAIYRDGNNGISKDYLPDTGDIDQYSVTVETQLQILQSRTLALEVVRKLGLANSPEGSTAANDGLEATHAESATVDELLKHLSVDPVKQTRVIQVSYTGPNPEMSARIVNALVDGFIEDSIRSRFEASNRASKFLFGQLTDLRAQVEESQEKLVRYAREHNIVGVDEKQNVVTGKLDDLNKQLTSAQGDRLQKEALYQTISAGSLDAIPDAKAGDALQSLRLREAEIHNEYAQAQTVYGPNHPKVLELTNRIKAIDASIQSELRRLRARAQGEYEVALAREQKLKEAFEQQKSEANRLSESAITYGILKREFDSNRQLFESLQERMKEAGVAAGLRSSNIRLIDAASVPDSPVSPNLPRSGFLGFISGLLVSAAVVAVREGLDRALHDPGEVESFTAMPPVAVIPLHRESSRFLPAAQNGNGEVLCLSHPRLPIAEAYRALGTAILLASPDLKTLLVTSPLPGEGKTSTAANTAVVIAQQGRRVLLVDADLRKPALHELFRVESHPGLSDVLLGNANTESAVSAVAELRNLSVLTAGTTHAFPAELLGSQKMRELMIAWRDTYDYVIIDTPPVLAVTDAVRLSTEADSVILVVRSGKTPREALARACDVLNQAQVPTLGVVVNGVTQQHGGYYYYGYNVRMAKSYYEQSAS